ncbi:MAG: HAD family hydrolase [Chloroflexi bacterium]|nr:HAD family hydrolase [Chloroflexota bacterium]MCI0579780.1 HAD family hydrolase [Chloroflexota bacterium]MCI0649152.1 HAD family hydrolase [Chloroflexota bacterium]MCI0731258.1 HAD family hydrolase [Chloroflexota bacterium]
MQPAIFLDRDGVIIENRPEYVRCWADVAIYPQALAALAQVARESYKIIVVTNQSAVGQGLLSLPAAQEINERLARAIEAGGGRVDGIFMCPHTPEAACPCRKPRPGLLLEAAQALSLDLSRSILIGDALTDLAAGRAAGIARNVLVRTGRGLAQLQLPEAAALRPFPVYDNLWEALAALL